MSNIVIESAHFNNKSVPLRPAAMQMPNKCWIVEIKRIKEGRGGGGAGHSGQVVPLERDGGVEGLGSFVFRFFILRQLTLKFSSSNVVPYIE